MMGPHYYVHDRIEAAAIIQYVSFTTGNNNVRAGYGFGREKCLSIANDDGESILTVIYLDDVK